MSFSRAAILALALLAPAGGAGAATIFGPTPYTSVADVPAGFYAGGAPDVLENFDEFVLEDGQFRPDFPDGVGINAVGFIGVGVRFPLGDGVPNFGDPTVDSVGTGGGFGRIAAGGSKDEPELHSPGLRVRGRNPGRSAHCRRHRLDRWTARPLYLRVLRAFGSVRHRSPSRRDHPDTGRRHDLWRKPGRHAQHGRGPVCRSDARGRHPRLHGDVGHGERFELDDLQWGRMAEPPSVIPLPAGLPLLAAGLGLMALLRRRA